MVNLDSNNDDLNNNMQDYYYDDKVIRRSTGPSEFPTSVRPMLATLIDKPFNNKDWVFETKWDGVRAVLFLHKTKKYLR